MVMGEIDARDRVEARSRGAAIGAAERIRIVQVDEGVVAAAAVDVIGGGAAVILSLPVPPVIVSWPAPPVITNLPSVSAWPLKVSELAPESALASTVKVWPDATLPSLVVRL